MKTLFLVLLATVLPGYGAPAEGPAPAKVRVLFIGNSFTAHNNLPGEISAMASASGRELTCASSLIGGASLKRHWEEGKALASIREGKWDYVVLQEGSAVPKKEAPSMLTHGALFDAEIRKAGAHTLLFMTWIRESSRADYAQLAESYAALARQTKARIVPVGTAWETALGSNDSAYVLYDTDKHHPSPAGSYLAACVFYRVLFDAPSKGLPNRLEFKGKVLADLPAEKAAALQKIADATPLPEAK